MRISPRDRRSRLVAACNYCVEQLETRRLLSQTVGTGVLSSATQTAGHATIIIDYYDNVTQSTLGNDDISVTSGNKSLSVQFVSQFTDNNLFSTTTATYNITDGGNNFVPADNGSFTISINSGAVHFSGILPIASGPIGTINIDAIAPTTTITRFPAPTKGAPQSSFAVTFNDTNNLNLATLGNNDFTITGPNNFTASASLVSLDSTNPPKVQYSFPAPGGSFDAADDGIYSINAVANSITDPAGNPVAAGSIGTFTVDYAPPTVTLLTQPTIDTSHHVDVDMITYDIQYSDDLALSAADASKVFNGIRLDRTPPRTLFSVTRISSTPTQQVYRIGINIPNDPANSGAYTFSDLSGFADAAGNVVPATTLGSFTLNFTPLTATFAGLINPATGQTSSVASGNTSALLKITYSSLSSTIDLFSAGSDIVVSGPGGFSAPATFQFGSQVTPTANVVYSINAPGGTFNSADNGTYTVSTVPGHTHDSSDNFVTAMTLGTFTIAIPPPTGALAAPINPITSPLNTFNFTVNFSGPVGLTNADVHEPIALFVTGPNGFTSVPVPGHGFSPTPDGVIPIDYLFIAPPGGFTAANNGSYTISTNAGAIIDKDGNSLLAAPIASFFVQIDIIPPSATLGSSPVAITSSGTTTVAIGVKYTDDLSGINTSTINSGDIIVTGPNNFSALGAFTQTFNNFNPPVNFYNIGAPAGGFTAANNGAYTISTVAGAVSDKSGNPIPAITLGAFTVNIDATPPSAALSSVTPITAGATAIDFFVTYTDNLGIDTSTIPAQRVDVSGIGLSGTAALINTTGAGTTITAHYSVAVPGGLSSAANGSYLVFPQPNFIAPPAIEALADTAGNHLPLSATIGSFTINLAPPTPLTAALAVTPTPAAGDTSITLAIAYSGNNPINPATANLNNLTLQGPGFSVTPNLIQTLPPQGNNETVQYVFVLPHALTIADNGTYTIASTSTGVADTVGIAVAAGSFAALTIAIAASAPPADTAPPTVSLTIPPKPIIDTATAQFTVTYTDNIAVNSSSIGNTNILITGPAKFSQPATLVSQSVSGNTITAKYSFPAPGGFFDPADNGAYTLSLRSNSISDTNNNFALAATLGAITLKLPQPAPGPDFTATWKSAPASTNPTTKTTPISFILKNSGAKPSKGTIQANIYAFTGLTFDLATAKLLATLNVPATLAKGQSATIKTTIPTPTKLPAGRYHLALILKAPPAMREQYHSNNTAVAKTITTIKQPTKKPKVAFSHALIQT